MPDHVPERRAAPRYCDSSLRFRWPGARRNEPVLNLSVAGASLQTVRSAPVGSFLEFELLHSDGAQLSLTGVVRRVERANRDQGSDCLGLSVEFRDLSEQSRNMLQSWAVRQDETSGAGSPAEPKAEPETSSGAGGVCHEGRLWEEDEGAGAALSNGRGSAEKKDGAAAEASSFLGETVVGDEESAADSDGDIFPSSFPSSAESEVTRANGGREAESFVGSTAEELAERLARTEQFAAEASKQLANAEDQIVRLEAQLAAERARKSSFANAVPAASKAAERRMVDDTVGEGKEEGSAGSASTSKPEDASNPISGAVRVLSEAAKAVEPTPSSKSVEFSAPDDLSTRAFSLEVLAVAKKANEVTDVEVEESAIPSTDEHPTDRHLDLFQHGPVASISEVKPPSQVEPPLDLGNGEEQSMHSDEDRNLVSGKKSFRERSGDPDDEGQWPELEVELLEVHAETEEDSEPAFGDGRRSREDDRALLSRDESRPTESSWADVDDTAEPLTHSNRLTFRELPTREGMLTEMSKGMIVRSERFDRLEPVSRADIQVSDLLKETNEISQLEMKARRSLGIEKLHRVLFVFFQRGLIEIERKQ